MRKKTGVAVFLATLFLFSFFITCASASNIQITITGGIGWHATVYNPYNTSFIATLNVTNLLTHKPIEDAWWTVFPYFSTTYFHVHFFVLIFISAHVVAMDKTATRNGVAFGPFVAFGPYK